MSYQRSGATLNSPQPFSPAAVASSPKAASMTSAGPGINTTISIPTLALKQHEIQYYTRLFNELDVGNTKQLDGNSIKGLFTASGLAKTVLADIWKLSDKDKKRYLDLEKFFIALRLISIAQAGLPVSYNSLKNYIDLPLPNFKGYTQSNTVQQQLNQQAQFNIPTINNNTNTNNTTNNSSYDPRAAVPPQQQKAALPNNYQPELSAANISQQSSQSEWAMSETEKSQYANLFSQADLDQDNYVAGKEAQTFFKLSQLDNETLKKIWRLADQDVDNKLNLDEFAVAMHLVLKVRKRFPLPATLPDVLKIQKPQPPQQKQQPIMDLFATGQSGAAPLANNNIPAAIPSAPNTTISNNNSLNDFEANFPSSTNHAPTSTTVPQPISQTAVPINSANRKSGTSANANPHARNSSLDLLDLAPKGPSNRGSPIVSRQPSLNTLLDPLNFAPSAVTNNANNNGNTSLSNNNFTASQSKSVDIMGNFGGTSSNHASRRNSQSVPQPPLSHQPSLNNVMQPNNNSNNQAAAIASARRELEDITSQTNVLSRTYSDSVSSLESDTAELADLKQKIEGYRQQKQVLQEKIETNNKTLEEIKSEIETCKKERDSKRDELLELDEAVKNSEKQIENARKLVLSVQDEVKQIQLKIENTSKELPRLKQQNLDADTELAMLESQLNQMRSELKSKEDLKLGQLSILQGRKDQAARLLKEKSELQAMIQKSIDELNRIKNEALVTKQSLSIHQEAITQLKEQLNETNELLQEERKNPSIPHTIQNNNLSNNNLPLLNIKSPQSGLVTSPVLINPPLTNTSTTSARNSINNNSNNKLLSPQQSPPLQQPPQHNRTPSNNNTSSSPLANVTNATPSNAAIISPPVSSSPMLPNVIRTSSSMTLSPEPPLPIDSTKSSTSTKASTVAALAAKLANDDDDYKFDDIVIPTINDTLTSPQPNKQAPATKQTSPPVVDFDEDPFAEKPRKSLIKSNDASSGLPGIVAASNTAAASDEGAAAPSGPSTPQLQPAKPNENKSNRSSISGIKDNNKSKDSKADNEDGSSGEEENDDGNPFDDNTTDPFGAPSTFGVDNNAANAAADAFGATTTNNNSNTAAAEDDPFSAPSPKVGEAKDLDFGDDDPFNPKSTEGNEKSNADSDNNAFGATISTSAAPTITSPASSTTRAKKKAKAAAAAAAASANTPASKQSSAATPAAASSSPAAATTTTTADGTKGWADSDDWGF